MYSFSCPKNQKRHHDIALFTEQWDTTTTITRWLSVGCIMLWKSFLKSPTWKYLYYTAKAESHFLISQAEVIIKFQIRCPQKLKHLKLILPALQGTGTAGCVYSQVSLTGSSLDRTGLMSLSTSQIQQMSYSNEDICKTKNLHHLILEDFLCTLRFIFLNIAHVMGSDQLNFQ